MRVFISYRRDDSDYATETIFNALTRRFGKENVFKDTDSIKFGDDFRVAIRAELATCDALLAILGPRWLSTTDESGCRRIDARDDWVRTEIEEAFDRQVRVVPVLLGKAKMPKSDDLPDSIRDLAFRHALTVRSGRDFQRDLDDLLQALEPTAVVPTRSRVIVLISVAVVLCTSPLLGSVFFGFPVDLTGLNPIRTVGEPISEAPSSGDEVDSKGSSIDASAPVVLEANVQWDSQSVFRGEKFGTKRGQLFAGVGVGFYAYSGGFDPDRHKVITSEQIVPISDGSITKWGDSEIIINFTDEDKALLESKRDEAWENMEAERAQGYLIQYMIVTADGKHVVSPHRKRREAGG